MYFPVPGRPPVLTGCGIFAGLIWILIQVFQEPWVDAFSCLELTDVVGIKGRVKGS